ncbi:MerR family transcriptional regulator [Chitinophaga filiformis]|uniref:MerR family transcriptional regulator n=1 Tax=Chitinophaga filiformis TaxID=104663 RepID=UPI001F3B6654|nr:MerR family transcriptional regulator [Chitinophaga filiformis]MCF6403841.1 MerR family transcriptional regulator [Chitinophaga filiformis]
MEHYAVKKLAKLAGVSVRTLHLYDQMGLLTPSIRTEARYRLYGKKELLRLQQILFYRELDIPLKEIREILDDPAFDLVQALENHKAALRAKQERISTLIDTIDKTLYHLKNKTMLEVEELYDGLSPEKIAEYREQAMNRWGKDRVLKGEDILRKLSKEEVNEMKQELDTVTKQLLASSEKDPFSQEVQTLIARHCKMITKFSGRTEEQGLRDYYKGLGELYLSDGRYTKVNGEENPAFAQFMQKAMKHFAETMLE